MTALLPPLRLRGTLPAIPSKSHAHRLLLCAALCADGPTELACGPTGQDVAATVRCLRALGADIAATAEGYRVAPITTPPAHARLDVGESGSTLRFLLPVICGLGVEAELLLHGRLPQRPLEPLWSALIEGGARLTRQGDTIQTAGRLTARAFSMDCGVSSQFLSGLLLACRDGGTLTLVGQMQSAGYLDMTVSALRRFGAEIQRTTHTIQIMSNHLTSPGTICVEGDWSNAAFWLCAAAIGGEGLHVTGLDPASAQGDRLAPAAIQAICAGNAELDCAQIPDLVPPLAVLAALQPGVTRFVNAARLRLKESDRLDACARLICGLGGDAEAAADSLTVRGCRQLQGGTVDSCGDHRIAMAAAIAAAGCAAPVRLTGAQAVEKSYAAFWEDYCRLGGSVIWEDAT